MKKLTKEPKYKIGQKVWRIYGNSAETVEVRGILAGSPDEIKISYIYFFEDGGEKLYKFAVDWATGSMRLNSEDWCEEEYIFPTKQALIESL